MVSKQQGQRLRGHNAHRGSRCLAVLCNALEPKPAQTRKRGGLPFWAGARRAITCLRRTGRLQLLEF